MFCGVLDTVHPVSQGNAVTKVQRAHELEEWQFVGHADGAYTAASLTFPSDVDGATTGERCGMFSFSY